MARDLCGHPLGRSRSPTEVAMKRRVLLLLIADLLAPVLLAPVLLASIALLGSASGATALPLRPISDWIRDIYTAQAARIASSQPPDEAEFLALFTPEVGALWRAAHRSPEVSAPEEQGFDALFGWRVPQGAKLGFVAVSKVLGTADAPTLLVDVVVSDRPRRIVIDAVENEGSWRIANIAYDEGEDFLSFERKLARR
jgi:hypothetical protein